MKRGLLIRLIPVALACLLIALPAGGADPQFSDMVLCYGGSRHRTFYSWDAATYSSFVTYTDRSGKEQWLFDAFLCLEFDAYDPASGTHYALMADQVDGPSGGRAQWQEVMDYWFAPDNGLDALDKSIESAAGRLGPPPSRRKVVMFLPDPIPFLQAKDSSSTQVYWGEIDGRPLDFSRDADRMAAYRWYVDSVRERFASAAFRNIELVGFYVMSECITIPSEPWTDHGKLHDLIPPLSDYVHSVGARLYWIPFYQGAGWRRGRELGFDYVWMQPNHFWRGDACPMSAYADFLREEGCGMEFEFDSKVFARDSRHGMYRERFREYMQTAVSEGIYGRQPITYYVDASFCLPYLQKSEDVSDRDFYHEFCTFVVNNPLRNKLK